MAPASKTQQRNENLLNLGAVSLPGTLHLRQSLARYEKTKSHLHAHLHSRGAPRLDIAHPPVSVTSRFTGTVFSVPVPNPFGSDLGDVYEMLINYDPDLLAGVAVGEGTSYESPAGASLITFSWTTTGDHFTSDNTFPVTIFIDDEPTGLGGDRDSFSLSGNIDDADDPSCNAFRFLR